MPPITVKDPATLQSLQQVLSYRKYPSTLTPLRPGSSRQQLFIGPGPYRSGPNDSDIDTERGVGVGLLFVNDVLAELNQPQSPHSDLIQFHVLLPFKVLPQHKAELLRLIGQYNNLLPLGRFALSGENQITYRYRWQVYERNVDGLVFLEILDTLLFFVERLGYRLEAVAQGQRSLEAVLQDEIDFGPQFE